MRRLIFSCILTVLLAGCAARDFAGISLAPGAAPAELQQLAARAEDGDKRALFELGLRYEQGLGVALDLARAEQLYAAAAASQPAYAHLRDVPVSKHGMAGVRRVQIGIFPGLPEARMRLAALRRAREND